jgi:hypothetical protein
VNINVDLVNETDLAVVVLPHDQFSVFSWNAALLQKAENVDAGAGANRGHEQVERRRRRAVTAAHRRLVGFDREPAVISVHTLAAGKIYLHIHSSHSVTLGRRSVVSGATAPPEISLSQSRYWRVHRSPNSPMSHCARSS